MQFYKSRESALLSAQQYILLQQKQTKDATGELTWLLSAITLASKHIAMHVRRDGLTDLSSPTGETNVHGELVQKMDEMADRILIDALGYNADVAVISSEENEKPVILKESGGKYIVFFDPLDGSSNLNVGVSVGTIFSIMRKPENVNGNTEDIILQPGLKQIAAGYIMYGSSSVLVLTTGDGVHVFTYDPAVGEYLLSKENLMIPDNGKYYSINEGNALSFDQGYHRWLDWVKSEEAGPYSARYIGSLVADFHRTLLKGGIFLYPSTAKSPEGKLRLMYEANPIAWIAEQAGGMAIDGQNRILEIEPDSLHQRTPLVVGSTPEVERLLGFLK